MEQRILFSGAAKGAEACFGETAERYHIDEVNFSFEGHPRERERGLRVLTTEELRHGDVSLQYVSSLMHRKYPNTTAFKKVLQTIWHMINSGQQVFVVGWILEDNTVKGGTGWGAEFAKLCNKDLYVYDQGKNSWFEWVGDGWQECETPKIREPHFAGTGTRFLEESGRQAIEDLFHRSFAVFAKP